MKSEIKYELPMFSSNLENEPQIEFKNMNVKITIKGYDENDAICETEINEEDFSFWKPKHYSLYLDGFGMYQFIAQSLEVEK